MHQRRIKVLELVFAAVLLLACMILLVRVTWARYQTEETSYLQYATRESGSVSLWSDYDPSTGSLIAGEIGWDFYDGSGTMDFYVSNYTAAMDYPDEDLKVSIRLLESLSITNAQVILYISDGNVTARWTATPVEIREGTPLFDSFGGGNTYMFLDNAGAELEWNLEGGTPSVLSMQIYIENVEQVEDAALLQLQVIAK